MLGFGLFAILVVIIFILLAQRRYFRAVEYLAGRGMNSIPGKTEATIPSGQGGTGESIDEGIVIAGPDTLTVGRSGEYSATMAGRATPVTWTVDPPDRANFDPTSPTGTVKVTPSAAGPLKIIANADVGNALCVTAEKPAEPAASVLGYVGSGWGSIVVAILVAAVVGALGIAKVLDGQAIAGLYGALLGYLFGVQAHGDGGASGGQADQTGGTGGTSK